GILEQAAAEERRDRSFAIALELGEQVSRDERAAPGELDVVTVRPGHGCEGGDRVWPHLAFVDHHRQPEGARLRGAQLIREERSNATLRGARGRHGLAFSVMDMTFSTSVSAAPESSPTDPVTKTPLAS